MRNVIIVLMLLICSLAVTPKYAFTDEDPWEFADIHIAPIFNAGLLGPFGGYMGGSGDFSDLPTAMDWSIGNTVPFSPTATDDMVFSTTTGSWVNPLDWVERMRITKDGNVGIGTDTPTYKLHVKQTTVNQGIIVEAVGTTDFAEFGLDGATPPSLFIRNSNGDIRFLTNGSEDKVRITNAGYVGIGTMNPDETLVVTEDQEGAEIDVTTYAIGAAHTSEVLVSSARGTMASPSAILAGDFLGSYLATGYGATDWADDQYGISFIATEDWTDSDHGGCINFSVFANESTIPEEAMTIDQSGNVGIGTTLPPTKKLEVYGTSNNAADIYSITDGARIIKHGFKNDGREWTIGQLGTTVIPNYLFSITDETAGAARLTIDTSGNVGIDTASPNYKLDVRGSIGNNTTLYHSDIRWKKNVSTIKSALNKVTDLRGVKFEWRADKFPEMVFPKGSNIGFVAQEVEEILPELVSTGKDGFKSVQYANIVPILVEAVKELKAENDNLRETLTAMADRQKSIEDMLLALSTNLSEEKLVKLDQINIDEVQKAIH